jgi:predicted RNase H-like nuclease (RuvC/YqgF family)
MAICNDILNNNKLVNEYNINIDNLVIDNIKINETIIELKTNNNKQKDQIKNQNIKIEEENKNQNIKINNLEIEIIELKLENKKLKEENKELKEEIKELKEENKELKFKMNKMENRFYMTKIITALQDLNSCDKLEIKLNAFNKTLKKLRDNRNTCNHYIYDDDDIDNINKKKTYLLNQLINISEDIKITINKSYGKNLIETIIDYLKDNTDTNSEVSDEDLSYIESWWEY